MTDRKEFEKWVEKHPATMIHRPVEKVAWAAWQASRRAALTDAAKLADRYGREGILRLRDRESGE